MRIKGHSIIELTDVKTGKVERYEDDNMLTNAISNVIKDLGMLYNSPLKSVTDLRQNPIRNLMGGLLLLGDNIDEQATIMTVPGGIDMIGNGAAEYVANNDDGVTEFGSWNYEESKFLSDGSYKMVWDFTGPQALGTIKCACLTSQSNGYVGIGNKTSGYSRASKARTVLLENTTDYSFDQVSWKVHNRVVNVNTVACNVIYVDYYNLNYSAQHSAEHMKTTGKVKLITQKLPLGNFDIRQTVPYAYVPSGVTPVPVASQTLIPITTTEIVLPSAFVTALGNSAPSLSGRFGDYYYMVAENPSALAPSAVAHGVRINCSTLAVQSFTITNPTETAFSGYQFGISFGNDTVALYSNGNRLFFQDIFDNSDYTEVPCSISYGGSGVDAGYGASFMREDSFVIGTGPQYRVDMVSRTLAPTNGVMNVRYGRPMSVDNPFLMNWVNPDGGYWDNDSFRLSYVNDYIATINNLSEPVQKTADKTMKVTYILHFDVS